MTLYGIGSVAVTDVEEEVEVEWKINGFFSGFQKKNTVWESPTFEMRNEMWHFTLYPNGRSIDKTAGWIHISLRKKSESFGLYNFQKSTEIAKNLPERLLLKTKQDYKSSIPILPSENQSETSDAYTFGIKTTSGYVFISSKATITYEHFFQCDKIFKTGKLLRKPKLNCPDKIAIFYFKAHLNNRRKDEVFHLQSTGGDSVRNMNEETGGIFGSKDADVLARDLEDLFLSEENCDVIMNVNGHEFKGHRNILAARSPIFASMFENETEERISVINIENCDTDDAFRDFLLYLYTAKIDNLSPLKVVALHSIASKYNVSQLSYQCLKFMLNSVTVQNFPAVFSLVRERNDPSLIKAAEKFFAENAEQILLTTTWKSFMKENVDAANDLFVKCLKRSNDKSSSSLTSAELRAEKDLKNLYKEFMPRPYFT